MAYGKNKKMQLRRSDSAIIAKRTVLTIIVLSVLVVILALFFNLLMSPKRLAEQNIETIARDYYENYLYESIVSANSIGNISEKKPLAKIMEKYEKSGFSEITLRQLLLYDTEKYASAATALAPYCDENATYIKIFPVAPFGKTDYEIDYNYSCTF